MTQIAILFILFVVSTVLHLTNCDDMREAMVFEAFSRGKDTAYSLYMSDDVSKDGEQHFKHRLVNMWGNEISVQTVTIKIMRNKQVEAYVVFNGTDTNKVSWLKQERVLRSSYTDIKTSSANYFSIQGVHLPSGQGRRAFYMNRYFKSCPGDVGWIQMKSGLGTCSWERSSKPETLVSYSAANTAGLWEQNLIADSMRIYIRYKENFSSTTMSSTQTELSSTATTTRSGASTAGSSETTEMQKTTGTTIDGGDSTVSTDVDSSTQSLQTTLELSSTATTTPSGAPTTASRKTTEMQKTTGTTLDDGDSTVSKSPFTSAPSSTENLSVSSVEIWSSTDVDSSTQSPKTTLEPKCNPCCKNRNNFSVEPVTMDELKGMVTVLKLQLQVNKSTLSQSIRRLTSATDNRSSAVAVGSIIGGSTAAFVFSIIVLPDLFSLGRFMWMTLKRRS